MGEWLQLPVWAWSQVLLSTRLARLARLITYFRSMSTKVRILQVGRLSTYFIYFCLHYTTEKRDSCNQLHKIQIRYDNRFVKEVRSA